MLLELFEKIDESNFDKIKKLLQDPQLKIIRVRFNGAEDKMREIINIIFENNNLEEIRLDNCGLFRYIYDISDVLSHNTNLKVLHIVNDYLGLPIGSEDKFGKFMEAIKINNFLEELSISYNYISNDSIKKIADMLLVNTKLRRLDISWGCYNDGGFIEIIKVLEHNFTLLELNMRYCTISHDIVPQLMKMLEINNVITIYGIDNLLPENFFISRNSCRKIKSAAN